MLYANDGTTKRRSLRPGAHTASDAVWLDLVDPTDAERAAAERITGLRVPSRQEVAEIENSSRVFTENGAAFLSMPYCFLDPDGNPSVSSVGFVLSAKHLLTLRFEALPAFDAYSEKFSQAGAKGSGEAFIGLVETIVDRLADILEKIAAGLAHLSKETFRGEDQATGRSARRRIDRKLRFVLTAVGECGDQLGNLRDSVLGIGRIVGYVQQIGDTKMSPALKNRLQTIRQDIASLNDYEQQLNSKVSFLLDAVLGFINIEQNNSVKVLTVVSVVGIPPTFVVGLYGMNFKSMPEYDWAYGYAFGWAMIVVSVLVPLIWMRVKGWL
jgi:magnesium transporter